MLIVLQLAAFVAVLAAGVCWAAIADKRGRFELIPDPTTILTVAFIVAIAVPYFLR
ncbi:hypothetical protein D3C72_561630 [compost metagenome]